MMNAQSRLIRNITILILLILVVIPWFIDPVKPGELQKLVPGLIKLPLFETKYLYVLHHLLAGLPVFAFGWMTNFYNFRNTFKSEYWKPLQSMMIIYILWDFIFVQLGIWGFNKNYILFEQLKFPIEELIWFLVIGFCSIFIYHLVDKISNKVVDGVTNRIGILLSFVIFFLIYINWIDRMYTAMAATSCLIALAVSYFRRDNYINYMISFMWILIPMIIFDGLLTGMFTQEAVVIYNPNENSGIRLISIPIEDFLFGFSYIYGIVLMRRNKEPETPRKEAQIDI